MPVTIELKIEYTSNLIMGMMTFSVLYEQHKETVDWLLVHTHIWPKVAIICDTGLKGLTKLLN